jgi:hypothetical protein
MFERDKGPPDASGSPYHERVPSVFALERIPFEWNISGIGEIVGALLGVKRPRMLPRASHRAATVRAAIFRSNALSLAKACSIGLRSGL